MQLTDRRWAPPVTTHPERLQGLPLGHEVVRGAQRLEEGCLGLGRLHHRQIMPLQYGDALRSRFWCGALGLLRVNRLEADSAALLQL